MDMAKKGPEQWREQQSDFVKALLDPSKGVPGFVGETAGQPSRKRFNVYRNNIMVSLTEAINDTYPVVAQLVGEEFATAMARVYVGDHLPLNPVLAEYGEGYGDFIATFEPAKSLPFLPDMARLEWAWLSAYHSSDQIPLTVDALGDIGEDDLGSLCVEFCSSVHLLRSDYPIASIWSAHQDTDNDQWLEDVVQQGEHALVNRPSWDVEVHILEPAIYAFFNSLQAGAPLGVSIDKGNTFANFDPGRAINALFATQCVAALKTGK